MARSSSIETELIQKLIQEQGLGDTATLPAQLTGLESQVIILQEQLARYNQDSQINVETLADNKVLTTEDVCYQKYDSDAIYTVQLPATPLPNQKFAFVNDNPAEVGSSFMVDNIEVGPGDRYEIIFDGTGWTIL